MIIRKKNTLLLYLLRISAHIQQRNQAAQLSSVHGLQFGFIYRKNEAIKVDYICHVYAIQIRNEDSLLTRHSLSKISFQHPVFPEVLAPVCLHYEFWSLDGLAVFEHFHTSQARALRQRLTFLSCFKTQLLNLQILLCDDLRKVTAPFM